MIGIFYTNREEVEDWVKGYTDRNPQAVLRTRLGVPETMTCELNFEFSNHKKSWEEAYKFIKINIAGPAHQGLCGIILSGAHFLGESTVRVDIVNYIMTRLRG